jgi:hypothetical protein
MGRDEGFLKGNCGLHGVTESALVPALSPPFHRPMWKRSSAELHLEARQDLPTESIHVVSVGDLGTGLE